MWHACHVGDPCAASSYFPACLSAGRGYQWSHDHQQLQLLQVAGDAPHIDPAAAAAAGGDSYDPQPPAVLVAPFESLEVAAKQGQLPLLVAVDAAQSDSCRPTQQQLDGFRDTLRDRWAGGGGLEGKLFDEGNQTRSVLLSRTQPTTGYVHILHCCFWAHV